VICIFVLSFQGLVVDTSTLKFLISGCMLQCCEAEELSLHPHNACHTNNAQYGVTTCIYRVVLVTNIFAGEKGTTVVSKTLSHLSIYAVW
jgi:hypothetical protein